MDVIAIGIEAWARHMDLKMRFRAHTKGCNAHLGRVCRELAISILVVNLPASTVLPSTDRSIDSTRANKGASMLKPASIKGGACEQCIHTPCAYKPLQ